MIITTNLPTLGTNTGGVTSSLYSLGYTRAQITAMAAAGFVPGDAEDNYYPALSFHDGNLLAVSFTPDFTSLPTATSIELLQAYLTGRENQTDDVGAVARFFRDGPNTIIKNVADLKTAARFYGPNVTSAQIDAAFTAAGVTEN